MVEEEDDEVSGEAVRELNRRELELREEMAKLRQRQLEDEEQKEEAQRRMAEYRGQLDEQQRAAAMACLGDADATAEGLDEVIEAMRAVGSLDATREVAARYAEQARTALSVLPPSPARDALGELPQFVVNRGH